MTLNGYHIGIWYEPSSNFIIPQLVDRQGLDIGSQYRSVIFYHNEEQREIAENVKEELNQSDKYAKLIVPEIAPKGGFFIAEDYHQRYYAKHFLSGH